MDPPTPQAQTIINVSIAFIILTFVAVGLRVLSRRLTHAGFWWDDGMIIVTLVVVTASNCTRFGFVQNGLGQHIANVPPAEISGLLKFLWTDMFLYNFGIAGTKLSAILLYDRTFPSATLHRAVQIFIGYIVLWLIGSCAAVLFQCSPVSKFWDVEEEGHCVDFVAYILGQAVPNIVADFFTLSLPMPFLVRLHISLGRKIAIILIFLIGYAVTAVSIVRTVVILQVNPTSHHDITWNFYYPNLWSSIEQTVGLVCVCLPAMGVLFRRLSQKLGKATRWEASAPSMFSSSKYSKNAPLGPSSSISHTGQTYLSIDRTCDGKETEACESELHASQATGRGW